MAKCVMLKNGGITDVTVGGASVVADGVAAIPVAANGVLGAVSVRPGAGIFLYQNGMAIEKASIGSIANHSSPYGTIVCDTYDYAVKCAMTDGKGASWTDAERQAALARMGCTVGDDGVVKFTAQET